MAEQSFPFENIDTTESQFSEWATNFQETGVQGSPDGTELTITVTGSDLNLTVAAGQAFIRGHYYINTSDLVIAVPTAGVNTRIDIVVVELNPETNTIVTKLVQGEAVSADPVAPTLTQSPTGVYQLPIATLTIPTSTVAITAGMLVDTRTFMGNRIGIWTTATRPANPTAYQTLGYNTTIGSHESWNGTSWVGFFDPITTEGDMVVGDATGQVVRLPVGEEATFLKVVGGIPEWGDGAKAAMTYQVMPGNISQFDWPFESDKSYGYIYYGEGLTVGIFDADNNKLSTLPTNDNVQFLLDQPADASKMVMSTTSEFPVHISFAELIPEPADSSTSVVFIDTTRSITLEKSYTAYLIGGGGKGGNVVRASSRSGGGGGSGYLATGVLTAGTYTATVGGANGGTTSVGDLTAAGGSNGLNTGGAGGAGGSGGGGGYYNSSNRIQRPGAQGGANGASGTTGGGNQTPAGGTGSGNEVVSTFLTELLFYGPPAIANDGASGFYRGGNGGESYTGGNGQAAISYGGGGDGANCIYYDDISFSGGNGYQGLIVLVEVA